MKRFIIGMCTVLALAALFAACGPSTTSNQSGGNSSSVNVTPAQGAGSPESSAVPSNPQQQPGSAIGAPPSPTSGGGAGGTGGTGAESGGTGGTGNTGNNSGSTGNTGSSSSGNTSGTGNTGNTGNNSGSSGSNTGNTGVVAPSGAADPCTLVTPQQIQTATGTAVQTGQKTTDASGVVSCTFLSSDSSNPASVVVTVYQGDAQVQTAQTNTANGSAVSNLGDQAVSVQNGVYVKVGDKWFSIIVAPAANSQMDTSKAAQSLAGQAVQNFK